MAWGEIKLEDLVKAGLDPEVLKKTNEAVTGLDDKIKNAVTEATKGYGDTLTGIQNTLQGLQTKMNAAPVKDGKEGQQQQQQNNEEEQADWLMDPEKATRQMITKQVGGVAMSTAQMRSDMNYMNFKATLPRGFSKYEKEIKEMYEKDSLVSRQHPDFIKNVYKVIIADHVDEIAKAGETFFLEPSISGNSHANTDVKKKAEDVLSKDELELAAKWGVTAEDYLKEKTERSVTYA